MTDSIDILVTDNTAGMRLDKLLSSHLTDMSRSRIQALIKQGCVALVSSNPAVNTERTIVSPSVSVKPGEQYRLVIPDAIDAEPAAENIPLSVTYEDEHLIVINKSAGMVVHPAPGSPDGTLVNALLHHCGGSLSGIGGVKRPGIVHRIDKDTSGLLVVAKHDKAHTGLAEQFAAHTIERRYHAICKGRPNPLNGRIEGNIGRNPRDRKKMTVVPSGGKHAVTHYQTLNCYQQNGHAVATYLECQLETGRTHQVRVHMMNQGNPLIGDPLYARSTLPSFINGAARAGIAKFKRQALHAKSLGFDHPITGQPFKFECDLPYDFIELLENLEPYKVA